MVNIIIYDPIADGIYLFIGFKSILAVLGWWSHLAKHVLGLAFHILSFGHLFERISIYLKWTMNYIISTYTDSSIYLLNRQGQSIFFFSFYFCFSDIVCFIGVYIYMWVDWFFQHHFHVSPINLVRHISPTVLYIFVIWINCKHLITIIW